VQTSFLIQDTELSKI